MYILLCTTVAFNIEHRTVPIIMDDSEKQPATVVSDKFSMHFIMKCTN